ncbi:MAG: hypothetical protein QF441_07030 [Bacteriovoracaceae bacterium]|jgi:hypothetical protein|nr:hypothetical protein [Halobacteriovoraceae bacterium]MDP7320346.1 hypothetical protein [Bacteriovoracaceae bacterium]
MDLGIKHLSNAITPQSSGILWLTDEKLTYKTLGVYEFNYLLDGILIKNIANTTNDSKSNFFLGESFGNPFFIGHTIIQTKEDIANCFNHVEIAAKFIPSDSTIYIFNRAKNTAHTNILKELEKKFNVFQFKNLNI